MKKLLLLIAAAAVVSGLQANGDPLLTAQDKVQYALNNNYLVVCDGSAMPYTIGTSDDNPNMVGSGIEGAPTKNLTDLNDKNVCSFCKETDKAFRNYDTEGKLLPQNTTKVSFYNRASNAVLDTIDCELLINI